MAWIRASQGGGGPTPTRITPGNSNPPYLVEGEVYEMNGNGRAIGSLTSLTPSNDSPVFLNPNDIYKPDVSGYAVGSVTPITPSNSTPAPLSTSYVYKPSESGYAIKSYQSITPSASGAAFNAGFVKMSAGGYACTSQPSGGVTLDDLNITNKTLFKNVTLDKNKTEEFTTTQDLLVVGTMHGYNNNYKTTFYIDNIEFLSTKASSNTAFVIPSPYGILIPKNHTIKIVTANYSACALKFYIK